MVLQQQPAQACAYGVLGDGGTAATLQLSGTTAEKSEVCVCVVCVTFFSIFVVVNLSPLPQVGGTEWQLRIQADRSAFQVQQQFLVTQWLPRLT